ncbi:hypothetical protein ABW19_dt0202523 [Dactylella cylindrospora]|nr:hypothetical protein ABW19_dt0202523 [Dactylella cylindrospora]
MALRVILEEFIEESEADFSQRNLNDFLEAAEKDGKLSESPEISLEGGVGEAKEPEILPFGPKKKNAGNIPAHKGDDGAIMLDEGLTSALQSLNKSLKTVDAAVTYAGNNIHLAKEWWKEVRKEILDREFDKAKFDINNFRHDLDPVVDEQQALAEALGKLADQL